MPIDLAAIRAATAQSQDLRVADMTELFWVICGEKQVGKSTFLSRFPDPFILDVEHRLDSITTPEGNRPGQQKIHEWDELVDWTDGYAQTTPDETGIKTFGVDGAGVAYRLLGQKILATSKAGAKNLNDQDLGYAKGWMQARDEFLKWWMSLRKLKEQGYGVVVTTHDRSVPFSNNGVDFDRKVPLIADDKDEKYGWNAVRPYSDIVIHVSKKRTSAGVKHIAQVRGNDLIEAGFPSKPDGSWMPEQLEFAFPLFRAEWDRHGDAA